MSNSSGILYMVATPIGNLGDITLRALEILKKVEVIACEDTRVTQKLLRHFDIHQKLLSLHHHSSDKILNSIVERLVAGESVAYASDAGTPGISDPGGKLVAEAIKQNIKVEPLPGASAVTAILSVAGLPTNNYLFLGFPPHKKGRQTFFKAVAASEYPVVFFESTHRIMKALTEMAQVCPSKQLVVGRELTKQFETIYRGFASEVIEQIKTSSSKGEFVVIVGGLSKSLE